MQSPPLLWLFHAKYSLGVPCSAAPGRCISRRRSGGAYKTKAVALISLFHAKHHLGVPCIAATGRYSSRRRAGARQSQCGCSARRPRDSHDIYKGDGQNVEEGGSGGRRASQPGLLSHGHRELEKIRLDFFTVRKIILGKKKRKGTFA